MKRSAIVSMVSAASSSGLPDAINETMRLMPFTGINWMPVRSKILAVGHIVAETCEAVVTGGVAIVERVGQQRAVAVEQRESTPHESTPIARVSGLQAGGPPESHARGGVHPNAGTREPTQGYSESG